MFYSFLLDKHFFQLDLLLFFLDGFGVLNICNVLGGTGETVGNCGSVLKSSILWYLSIVHVRLTCKFVNILQRSLNCLAA